MDKEKFIEELSIALDTESSLSKETSLSDLEEWDSLGVLSVIELMERYKSDISIETIHNAITINDLILLLE